MLLLTFINLISFFVSTLAATSIIVPLYIYPTPNAWDPLFKAVETYPQQHFTVILNIDSGPGVTKYPNSDYIASIAKLNSFTNVQTIGYVHISYATRKAERVNRDIALYAGWANYDSADISVRGIFVDEAPNELGNKSVNLLYMKAVHAVIKKNFEENSVDARVVTNPGSILNNAFYDYADTIISFEDTLADIYAPYTLFTNKNKSQSYAEQSKQQGVIINHYDKCSYSMAKLVQKIVHLKKVGEFYITTFDDYNEFSTFFASFIKDVVMSNGHC